MANKQKRRGDQFERDVLATCHAAGFDTAIRTRPGRKEDQGDIFLTGDSNIIIQCKDVQTPRWREWKAQLELQKERAKAKFAFIAFKRRGMGPAPALQLAVLPLEDLLELLKGVDL